MVHRTQIIMFRGIGRRKIRVRRGGYRKDALRDTERRTNLINACVTEKNVFLKETVN